MSLNSFQTGNSYASAVCQLIVVVVVVGTWMYSAAHRGVPHSIASRAILLCCVDCGPELFCVGWVMVVNATHTAKAVAVSCVLVAGYYMHEITSIVNSPFGLGQLFTLAMTWFCFTSL